MRTVPIGRTRTAQLLSIVGIDQRSVSEVWWKSFVLTQAELSNTAVVVRPTIRIQSFFTRDPGSGYDVSLEK